MRVVDEETLNDADLETQKEEDHEKTKQEDAPVDKISPPLPEPEFIAPEEEKEFIPVKPKRKPRAKKPEVLIPALEKPPEAFKETSKIRKDRLKEQIDCPNGCGKKVSRHAASYTHNKHCSALKKKDEVDCYEPRFHEKEAEKATRVEPSVPPNVEFVERVRQAAWAWHELEKQKHGMLIRQYYGR